MFKTLITPKQLSDLSNVVLFDCRFDLSSHSAGQQSYLAAHIPGAFYLHLEQDLSGEKNGRNGRHPLPAQETFMTMLRKYGVSDTTQVVAYDAQGGLFAARLWWLLRWLGHEAVAVLDGGIQAWQAAGGTVTAECVQPVQGSFTQRLSLQPMVTVDDVLTNLGTQSYQVVDARSPDRFRGENETLDPVGGHIPHAVNRFCKDNLETNGYFKSAQTLYDEWCHILGDYSADRSIQQCGSGVTACHNLLALEIAGLTGAALYPGSWSEWCADKARPVENRSMI